MRFVIDTSEIFSFFNRKSKARELSLLPGLELYAPAFSLHEIKMHKADILKRFSLSNEQFRLIEKLLSVVVKFAGEKEYSEFMNEAK